MEGLDAAACREWSEEANSTSSSEVFFCRAPLFEPVYKKEARGLVDEGFGFIDLGQIQK